MDRGGERLTERERTILREIELELQRQDPALQRSLTATGLPLPYRIPVWGYLFVALVMIVGAFVAEQFTPFVVGVVFVAVAHWRNGTTGPQGPQGSTGAAGQV